MIRMIERIFPNGIKIPLHWWHFSGYSLNMRQNWSQVCRTSPATPKQSSTWFLTWNIKLIFLKMGSYKVRLTSSELRYPNAIVSDRKQKTIIIFRILLVRLFNLVKCSTKTIKPYPWILRTITERQFCSLDFFSEKHARWWPAVRIFQGFTDKGWILTKFTIS